MSNRQNVQTASYLDGSRIKIFDRDERNDTRLEMGWDRWNFLPDFSSHTKVTPQVIGQSP